MFAPLIVAVFTVIPSLVLIRAIERRATRLSEKPLAQWRRLLIPLPIILLLAGNLDGVAGLGAYLQSHPGAVAARYSENQAWNTDRFFYAGVCAAALLPFVLAVARGKSLHLLPLVWGGHLLWIFFPLCPLLLASGVPLQS